MGQNDRMLSVYKMIFLIAFLAVFCNVLIAHVHIVVPMKTQVISQHKWNVTFNEMLSLQYQLFHTALIVL